MPSFVCFTPLKSGHVFLTQTLREVPHCTYIPYNREVPLYNDNYFTCTPLSLSPHCPQSLEYVRSGMMAEAYRASVLARLFARLAITFGIVHITIVVCCAVVVPVSSI